MAADPSPAPRYRTAKWAAATLGIALSTVIRLAKTGEIDGFLRVGGRYYIQEAAFLASIEQHKLFKDK